MSHPLRRKPRLDDDYYGVPQDPYDQRPYVIQDQPPPSHRTTREPSRRHRSDRPRSEQPRRPEPDYGREQPYGMRRRPSLDLDDNYRQAPPRGSSRREAPGPPPTASHGGRMPMDPPPIGRHRGRSPPPYVPEPPRHDRRASRHERDPYLREQPPYDRERRSQRDYVPELSPRDRDRERDRRGRDNRPPRGPPGDDYRDMPRSRNAYPAGGAAAAYYEGGDSPPRRRPRSQAPRGRGSPSPPPPRNRSRPPPAGATRGGVPPKRRNSMPASTKPKGKPWWQNPLIQAGGRAAFAAGAQAAMKSRNDSGPWLGPKGAKIATAAIGAALVDGFIGSKHPKAGDLMHQGVGMAADNVDAVPGYIKKSRSRHR